MVHEILSTGVQNAMTGNKICDILGLRRRDLTQTVEQERRKGYPICASTDVAHPGYFLAADKAEMERYCRSLDHRVTEISKTRAACIKAMDALPEREADHG